jgi:hypothetical protein
MGRGSQMTAPPDIYIEFIVQGNVVKATAIDPVTGREASIVGPASAPRPALAQAARRKLEYLARKKP